MTIKRKSPKRRRKPAKRRTTTRRRPMSVAALKTRRALLRSKGTRLRKRARAGRGGMRAFEGGSKALHASEELTRRIKRAKPKRRKAPRTAAQKAATARMLAARKYGSTEKATGNRSGAYYRARKNSIFRRPETSETRMGRYYRKGGEAAHTPSSRRGNVQGDPTTSTRRAASPGVGLRIVNILRSAGYEAKLGPAPDGVGAHVMTNAPEAICLAAAKAAGA